MHFILLLVTAALWGLCYTAAVAGQHTIALIAGVGSTLTMGLFAQHLRGIGATSTTITDSYNSNSTHHYYGSGAGGVGGMASGAPITVEQRQRIDVKLIPDVHIDDSALREALRLISAGDSRTGTPSPIPLIRSEQAPQSLPPLERKGEVRPALEASREPAMLIPIGERGGKLKKDEDETEKRRGFIAFALLGPPKTPAKRS